MIVDLWPEVIAGECRVGSHMQRFPFCEVYGRLMT